MLLIILVVGSIAVANGNITFSSISGNETLPANPQPVNSTQKPVYPMIAGLRCMVNAATELNIDLVNSAITQLLKYVPPEYNLVVTVKSIKKT